MLLEGKEHSRFCPTSSQSCANFPNNNGSQTAKNGNIPERSCTENPVLISQECLGGSYAGRDRRSRF